MIRKFTKYLPFFLGTLGCTESFDVEKASSSTRLLVVDGRITDQEGPYIIRLSSSYPLGLQKKFVETGAQVQIQEENGPTVLLVEAPTRPGTYLTPQREIRGEVGKNYRAHIRLSDGQEYVSSWELLQDTPEIGEITIEYLTKVDNIARRSTGVKLFLDTKDETRESAYFRWEVIETWQYEAGLVSEWIYLGNGEMAPKPPEDFHRTCWKNSKVTKIMTTSVNQLSSRQIVKFPLTVIPIDSARFDQRYSALVKQYVVGSDEYNFWKNLRDLNENLGSIYDQQPFEVSGNIVNQNDHEELVLGYFAASAVKEKRIFINNSDFPNGFRPRSFFPDCEIIPYRSDCGDIDICSERSEEQILELVEIKGETFYRVHSDQAGWDFTPRLCGDCENFGGLAVKPDFWIE